MLKTSQPFFTMALSKDGHTIFTVNPDTGTIGVVDASTLTHTNEITAAGKRPIYVIAAR
jgi:YVTN family beta-propeller protein